jgi:glucokinase
LAALSVPGMPVRSAGCCIFSFLPFVPYPSSLKIISTFTGMKVAGIDIGGTKCTVMLGEIDRQAEPTVLGKTVLHTREHPLPVQMISCMQAELDRLLSIHQIEPSTLESIGISCGGPLDSASGIILSPPNLPGWDRVPIVSLLKSEYRIPVAIQNDANACALAEWKYGAGKGSKNMVFITFGTGLGAGLILNGELYSGTNDNAGEIGHIRLAESGPVGYGKAGSFEGFCSGGGLAQLASAYALEKIQSGEKVGFCQSVNDLSSITAQTVARCAEDGDPAALEVYRLSGTYLGKGLSILIDILNPELIVIGSIYERAEKLLKSAMLEVIKREALSVSARVCQIVPAKLGDRIGEYAALSVAGNALK